MVALSFKEMFVDPIRVGLGIDVFLEVIGEVKPKRQTVRANGKRRPPRPGETLQLYCGMRTKKCRKIGDARCTKVEPIELRFVRRADDTIGVDIRLGKRKSLRKAAAETFARADGFRSLDDFIGFWLAVHGAPPKWNGNVIYWEPLTKKAPAEAGAGLDRSKAEQPRPS
jgi:hypothetical protein